MRANTATPALFARAPHFVMLAYTTPFALLTFAPLLFVYANADAPAITAILLHPPMLADAAAPAIFASVPHFSVLTNATAPAILASMPHFSVLTNTTAPTVFA